ncbi:MAG TPA: LacI family DNA-binding transcriptional regulator [Pseudobacteroides sp.]|uniref:LacI family DNA-binding transcriptional regulator n=1 Tax=Pseudobacteroides sp. TaxID=1968840 RepID=UPI002F928EA5
MQGKVSMEDIAAKLGITKNTVSLVFRNMPGISEKTRKSVLETAKQLGYRYKKDARSIDGKKTPLKNICLLQSKSTYDTTGFFAFIQLGIESEAKKNSLNLMLHVYDDSDENFEVPMCINEGLVSGVITIGRVQRNTANILNSLKIPMVMVDHYYEDIYIDYVLSDNQNCGYIATEYLIKQGHTQLGFSGDIKAAVSFYDRYMGFLKALDINNIRVNPDYLITDKCIGVVINEGLDNAVDEMKKLPSMPTAFFCCNDHEAISMIKALNVMGYKVPSDISIISFDNIDSSHTFSPRLTTLNVHKEHMGAKAVQKLIERINSPNGPKEKILLSAEIIERQSVKNLKNNNITK